MMYIFGLGNPGKKYEKTKHNVGFEVLDILSDTLSTKLDSRKFRSVCGKASYGGEQLMLLKPQTFMNESGKAVQAAMAFFKFPVENTIVVYDDFALPLGTIRIRKKGGAGGHNGIKSIIGTVGENFIRVRVGIGTPENNITNFVLSGFSKEEQQIMKDVYKVAADSVISIIEEGVDNAMNKYNSYTHDNMEVD